MTDMVRQGEAHGMKPRVRVSFTDGRGIPFMGIGLVWLIRGIARFGSIRRAAGDMGMSYVKALRIVNLLERGLGEKMLHRRRGGAARGGASLTPYAKAFINAYEGYHDRVNAYALKEYARIFGPGRGKRRR
ncbi:MAG: LysR family transcriptional regulator [Candidatus Aureabacteria bacterium]|nr:LysR family transcriptional regulator [Candidatus Auribacterota bacterium]